MTRKATINEPILKPKVKIEKELREYFQTKIQEQSKVIVQCSFTGGIFNSKIRIWPSTFLYAKNSNHKSELLHAENITLHPTWRSVEYGQTINFTLIFSALPKDCIQFDMIENIPESGGFAIMDIERNNTDVYFIEIS